MLRHYSHVRRDATRPALDSRSYKPARGNPPQEDHVTKRTLTDTATPQEPDFNGGADGDRTRDLLRDRQAF